MPYSDTKVLGVPAPAAPGTPQTMTVSGLTPGTLYYFAIRAQDEASNLSLNYAAADATTADSAIGPGTYDDTDPAWLYSADWQPYTTTGPYNGTIHYTTTTNATASLMFQAPAIFTFYYARYSNRGSFEIWVDGSLLTTIDPYDTTRTWQNTYTSPAYIDNQPHTIVVKNISTGGMEVDIDAITITP